jgi:hypothetical protein
MVLRPLLPSISHVQIREVHSSALAPMHARFADAWERHGTSTSKPALRGGEMTEEATSDSEASETTLDDDLSPDGEMRSALIEAVRRQQASVATRVSSAELFRSFAPPGADLPACLAEPVEYRGGTGDAIQAEPNGDGSGVDEASLAENDKERRGAGDASLAENAGGRGVVNHDT